MPPLIVPRPRLHPLRIALLAIAAITLAFAVEAAAGQSTKRVAKEMENATVGSTILTTLKGKTLYSLSVEKHGKFICTGNCLASWKPLTVPAGVKPSGPVEFGTVKRPEGKMQVTYKGLPLYSFNGDVKTGEANGEGLKDVGTWHAAKVKSSSPPPPAQEPESPYPY
jgi:predicted lipoprotein with Yx(FWY)xxD motif